ncbi:MAG: hypothetical protein RML37_12045 [Chitinophagales bacterium]|nr:hypothetical protein [Chitinophagales bacterium]
MNSPFAHIYLAIQQRIQTLVPEVKFIEHDFGQLDDYSNGRPPVAFPCVLIDFQSWQFENMGNSAQRAEGNVTIKLGYAKHGQSHQATPEQWREAALEYYDLEWKLNKALHGFSPGDNYGHLTRTTETKQNQPMYVRVKTTTYRLSFEDYSATPEQWMIDTPPLTVDF